MFFKHYLLFYLCLHPCEMLKDEGGEIVVDCMNNK